MKTHCNQRALPFQTKIFRDLIAHFNGGEITSDGGAVLLQQTETIAGIIKKFSIVPNGDEPDFVDLPL